METVINIKEEKRWFCNWAKKYQQLHKIKADKSEFRNHWQQYMNRVNSVVQRLPCEYWRPYSVAAFNCICVYDNYWKDEVQKQSYQKEIEIFENICHKANKTLEAA